jgi:hypothetical protein
VGAGEISKQPTADEREAIEFHENGSLEPAAKRKFSLYSFASARKEKLLIIRKRSSFEAFLRKDREFCEIFRRKIKT